MNKTKNIKTYGYGVVAQGFHAYLKSNSEENRLHTVIIKDPNKIRKEIKPILETTNSNTVKDKDMDVIVELISSSEDAYGIVSENLEIGKKVISANKKLIAENLEELIQIEQNNSGTLLYEGAVCGSIPIIKILNDLYAYEEIHEVKGIFNGSSNYILSQLFTKNISYQEALLQAQQLGFSEADPTSDVGGFDALYKLIIITAHAFGKVVQPHEVLTIGITSIGQEDIAFAKENNLTIKLIAKATLVQDELQLSVVPTLIAPSNELFTVENEYNAVSIVSENIGEQLYKGKGAGSLPTGAVVYADLKAIDQDYKYNYKKLKQHRFKLSSEHRSSYLLSLGNATTIDQLDIPRTELFALDEKGRRFIVTFSNEELLQHKFNILQQKVSILAIENEQVHFLLKSRFQLEGIGLN